MPAHERTLPNGNIFRLERGDLATCPSRWEQRTSGFLKKCQPADRRHRRAPVCEARLVPPRKRQGGLAFRWLDDRRAISGSCWVHCEHGLMIRPLTDDDVPHIPRLLATEAPGDSASLRRLQTTVENLFPRLFLETPHADPDIHGLVTVGDDGQLTGMIGTVARRMQFHDRPIRVAVSAELFVDRAHRSQMLGVKIFQHLMNGPQDLSFSDIGNDKSRKIWQSLGGTVASWYGLNWLKVLRPALLPLSLLSKSRLGKPV